MWPFKKKKQTVSSHPVIVHEDFWRFRISGYCEHAACTNKKNPSGYCDRHEQEWLKEKGSSTRLYDRA